MSAKEGVANEASDHSGSDSDVNIPTGDLTDSGELPSLGAPDWDEVEDEDTNGLMNGVIAQLARLHMFSDSVLQGVLRANEAQLRMYREALRRAERMIHDAQAFARVMIQAVIEES